MMHIMFFYVQVKKHMKKGKNLSMGFGFVEFDSVETATEVCKGLQVKPRVWSKLFGSCLQFWKFIPPNIFLFLGNNFGWPPTYFATLSCQARRCAEKSCEGQKFNKNTCKKCSL